MDNGNTQETIKSLERKNYEPNMKAKMTVRQ